MPQLRYEFITLGKGGFAENVIKRVISADTSGDLTTTPSADVAIPDGSNDGDLYVRLLAIGGDVYVNTAADAAATPTNSLRCVAGVPEVLAVDSDNTLSFRSVE